VTFYISALLTYLLTYTYMGIFVILVCFSASYMCMTYVQFFLSRHLLGGIFPSVSSSPPKSALKQYIESSVFAYLLLMFVLPVMFVLSLLFSYSHNHNKLIKNLRR